MADWTQEANEYLDGYLMQVTALVRRQGDDVEEVVSGVRDHIARELDERDSETVDLDTLFEVLATIGTPEEVASLDAPVRETPQANTVAEKPSSTLPPLVHVPLQQAPQQVIVKHHSWLSCAGAAVLFAGLGLVLISIIGVIAAIAMPSFQRAREAGNRSDCANNLKQISGSLHRYSNEHDGAFPPLSDEPGRLMFVPDALYPEYLDDLSVFICEARKTNGIVSSEPENTSLIDDKFYFYLSHVITNEEEGLAYVEAYRAAVRTGRGFEQAFTTADGGAMPRIREGVSFDLENTPASEIPLLIEKPDHHIPGGGHVLFLDGHVEFMKQDSAFPMTTSFIDALKSIDE
jgi:prepilin-type processing-associated H-X9-DG protein